MPSQVLVWWLERCVEVQRTVVVLKLLQPGFSGVNGSTGCERSGLLVSGEVRLVRIKGDGFDEVGNSSSSAVRSFW